MTESKNLDRKKYEVKLVLQVEEMKKKGSKEDTGPKGQEDQKDRKDKNDQKEQKRTKEETKKKGPKVGVRRQKTSIVNN